MLKGILILLCISTILLSQELLWAQTAAVDESQVPEESNAEVLYAGEVISVNSETSELNIQYYDYETDTLNEINFTLDGSTQFDKVKTLDEIIVGDTVNVECVKEADKNIAKRISVEKAEIEELTPLQKPFETEERKGD